MLNNIEAVLAPSPSGASVEGGAQTSALPSTLYDIEESLQALIDTEELVSEDQAADYFAGKRVALFSVPGAFTPTCSAKHLPGYISRLEDFQKKGVEVACLSVNDAFVMGAWGRDQKSTGKVRMMGDGSADFTKGTGLTLDLTARGMGLRSNRYSMLVKDGKVATLNIEGPGKFEVSDADTMLAQAKG